LASDSSRVSVLFASVRDISSVGMEDEKMSNLDTSRRDFWDFIGDAVKKNNNIYCKTCPAYSSCNARCHLSCAEALRYYYEHLDIERIETRRYKAKVWVNQEFNVVIEAGSLEEAKKKLEEQIEEFRSKLEFQTNLWGIERLESDSDDRE
jgi:hypothetical protein